MWSTTAATAATITIPPPQKITESVRKLQSEWQKTQHAIEHSTSRMAHNDCDVQFLNLTVAFFRFVERPVCEHRERRPDDAKCRPKWFHSGMQKGIHRVIEQLRQKLTRIKSLLLLAGVWRTGIEGTPFSAVVTVQVEWWLKNCEMPKHNLPSDQILIPTSIENENWKK